MSWSELDILNDAHVTRIKWLHFWSLHLLLSYFKVIAVALKVLEKSASGHPSVSLWLWTLVFIQRDVSSSHSFIFETCDINVRHKTLPSGKSASNSIWKIQSLMIFSLWRDLLRNIQTNGIFYGNLLRCLLRYFTEILAETLSETPTETLTETLICWDTYWDTY